jgi:uncharacterized protein YndB with AHSA1/START domain
MKKLEFIKEINAPAQKIWFVLWNDFYYRQWTSVFHEGSYAISDWKQGGKILFLSPDGDGMYSQIEANEPYEYMAFKHIGIVKNFIELPLDEETKTWSGGMETYILRESNGTTVLQVLLDAVEAFESYFNTTFPKAIEKIKYLSETSTKIQVSALVNAPIEKVWSYWTEPHHITQWCFASPDWHAPKAENDLKMDGKFLTTMAAKDGSFSFDLEGIYDEVIPHQLISYYLADGRTVKVSFVSKNDGIEVTELFDGENQNPYQMQEQGWQAILNNFKHYTETNQ